jgi:hypothetical protein
MKFPKSPCQLKLEIELSVKLPGDLRLRQLINLLLKVSDEIIVEGVFQTIENDANTYKTQKYAGRILKEINPRPNKDSKFYLTRVLHNWDKSCEEIPHWMLNHWSLENLKLTINEIENSQISIVEMDKLKTFKWWLNIKK